ncbi:hypothetical protein C4J87_2908 [Pseudomonas sp. R1-43-08]|nr:hypothetical protein C4J87_2908 [Pseudomonas sp. R1-43-08]
MGRLIAPKWAILPSDTNSVAVDCDTRMKIFHKEKFCMDFGYKY